jgi:uncharacterized protein (TIGR02145 family)
MLNFVCNKENFMKKMFWLCSAFVSLLALMGCGDVLVDTRDNQVYRTVTIGNQTWMAQNLNYRYVQLPNDSSSYCYNNIADSCAKYGRLYVRDAAMDIKGLVPGNNPIECSGDGSCKTPEVVRGVCPEGWHLPSKAEWDTLIAYAGGRPEAAKKLRTTDGWSNNNGREGCGNGSDELLFSARPAGIGMINFWDDPPHGEIIRSQVSTAQGYWSFFWSSTVLEDHRAFLMGFTSCDNDSSLTSSESAGVQQMAFMFSIAVSVRCIKD